MIKTCDCHPEVYISPWSWLIALVLQLGLPVICYFGMVLPLQSLILPLWDPLCIVKGHWVFMSVWRQPLFNMAFKETCIHLKISAFLSQMSWVHPRLSQSMVHHPWLTIHGPSSMALQQPPCVLMGYACTHIWIILCELGWGWQWFACWRSHCCLSSCVIPMNTESIACILNYLRANCLKLIPF